MSRPSDYGRRFESRGRRRSRDRELDNFSRSPSDRRRKPSPHYKRDRYSHSSDEDRGKRGREDDWNMLYGRGRNPPPAPPAPNIVDSGFSSYDYNLESHYDKRPPPQPPMPPNIAWSNLPNPAAPPAPAIGTETIEETLKKEEAIASEVRQQRVTLLKQKEEYMKKAANLQKELDTLRDQRNELRGSSKRSPSPDSKRFLKENAKLQYEIQNKLKTMTNVIEMLDGIIGEEKGAEKPAKAKSPSKGLISDLMESLNSEKKAKPRTRSRSKSHEKKFNYVYYDPEMHWCRLCNEFPSTAKDYLNHMHSPGHAKMSVAHMEAPWHNNPATNVANEGLPNFPDASTKRTPIKGLQFFVPATAWYCKLCDQWIGDLHCASAHLKSVMHGNNFTNFVEQNPHWESDWLLERQKSFEKKSIADKKKKKEEPEEEVEPYTPHTIRFGKDGIEKKKKRSSISPANNSHKKRRSRSPSKDKKKKMRERDRSSSGSSSSRGKKKKKNIKDSKRDKDRVREDRSPEQPDDKLIVQWMSAANQMDIGQLDKLKERVKKQAEKREKESKKEKQSVVDLRTKIAEKAQEAAKKQPPAKPVIEKKMPFIGKMPVFKLAATPIKKTEEVIRDLQQKEVVEKKRKEEMEEEIKKKVAEFKEKFKKVQEDQKKAFHITNAPSLVIPGPLGSAPPPLPQQPPQYHQPNSSNLHGDIQEALSIIFPSNSNYGQNQHQPQPPIQPLMGPPPSDFMPGQDFMPGPDFMQGPYGPMQPHMGPPPRHMGPGFMGPGPMGPGPMGPQPPFLGGYNGPYGNHNDNWNNQFDLGPPQRNNQYGRDNNYYPKEHRKNQNNKKAQEKNKLKESPGNKETKDLQNDSFGGAKSQKMRTNDSDDLALLGIDSEDVVA